MKLSSSINRPLLILTVLLVSSGCYTVLNHPAVETSSYDYDYASCYDCHSGAFFDYSYARVPYPGMWDIYYMEPWWNNEILITGEGTGGFRRTVIPGRDFRTRENSDVGRGVQIRRKRELETSPRTPSSLRKSDRKSDARRKARSARSRSDSGDRDSRKRRSSSGKKRKSGRDRD
jgi:hypothetical protein